jgi:hypothetical protein
MKIACALTMIASALVMGGCGKSESTPPPAAAPAPANSGNGYLGTLVKGQQTAIKTIDVTSLNENVRLFNVQEGRNPTDLKELVTKNYLGALPDPPAGMKLVYDAKEGKVSVAPQ